MKKTILNKRLEILSSPSVLIKLNSISKDSYEIFIDYLIEELQKKGLNLRFRNSWGFRAPSIEYMLEYTSKELIVKLYLGVYKGATFYALVELLNDILSNKNKGHVNELKKRGFKFE